MVQDKGDQKGNTSADPKNKKKSDEEIDGIVDRLHNTQTKSSGAEPCRAEATVAENTISRPATSEKETRVIFNRLNSTHTKSSANEECRAPAMNTEMGEMKQVPESELDDIIDRLHSTHTKSSSAMPCRAQPAEAKNIIAREPASQDEAREISLRLNTAHTKSSSGGKECKQPVPLKVPGYGQKCYPVIDGAETRFRGRKLEQNKVQEVIKRLCSAQTRSSQARMDNPQILLYPERTLLCNNVSRISAFQESGSTVKQKELARREKWFI